MIRELSYHRWHEFAEGLRTELFDGAPVQRGRFLFRGQGDSKWHLSSSFDRAFGDLTEEDRAELEESLKSNFQRLCESDPSIREHVDTSDDRKLLCFAQHFGLPTRLLDWTESPFVAAFFAFESRLQRIASGDALGDQVSVWVLERSNSTWTPRNGVEVFTRPTWSHDRLRNQQGWFSLSNTPFKTLEEYVNYADKTGNALRKITLPGEIAADALAELDLMNINYATLFGDTASKAKEAVSKALIARGTSK
jgi:hypothetical protein